MQNEETPETGEAAREDNNTAGVPDAGDDAVRDGIERAEWQAGQATARAQAGLLHYFKLAGVPAHGECAAEIRSIVDDIVEAGARTAAATILKELRELQKVAARGAK